MMVYHLLYTNCHLTLAL